MVITKNPYKNFPIKKLKLFLPSPHCPKTQPTNQINKQLNLLVNTVHSGIIFLSWVPVYFDIFQSLYKDIPNIQLLFKIKFPLFGN